MEKDIIKVIGKQNFLRILAIKALLRQSSASALRQLSDDAPEWGCNPFSSVSIDFNENRIASIMAELLQS